MVDDKAPDKVSEKNVNKGGEEPFVGVSPEYANYATIAGKPFSADPGSNATDEQKREAEAEAAGAREQANRVQPPPSERSIEDYYVEPVEQATPVRVVKD